MSKNKAYYRIINGPKWGELSRTYREKHPFCEECLKNGIYTPAEAVHHIKPIGTARSMREAEQLAFDETNLMALCIPCHNQMHKQLNSHSKKEVLKRKDNQAEIAYNKLFGNTD